MCLHSLLFWPHHGSAAGIPIDIVWRFFVISWVPIVLLSYSLRKNKGHVQFKSSHPSHGQHLTVHFNRSWVQRLARGQSWSLQTFFVLLFNCRCFASPEWQSSHVPSFLPALCMASMLLGYTPFFGGQKNSWHQSADWSRSPFLLGSTVVTQGLSTNGHVP